VNLIAFVDRLETTTEGYLVLEEVERLAGQDLSGLVADGVLLVDYRQRLTARGDVEPVTVCRLNRHHPSVKRLADWDEV
jgi:hypothetical protein